MASNFARVATWYTSGYKVEAVPGMSGKVWFSGVDNNVSVAFKYWNGSSMVTVPGISKVVDFTFGKAAPGRTNPTVYVRREDGTYWYSVDATAGTSFTWTQAELPPINNAPGVMEGDLQTFGRLYVGTNGRGIYYADLFPTPPFDGTYTWDGGPDGSGTSWNDPVNWSPDRVPDATSTVRFTDAGLSPGKVITLDGNQTIDQLVISTTTGFTLAAGGSYSLSLNGLERQDITGTESNQTISAPLNLLSDSTWTVNGSGVLTVSGGIAGSYGLTKDGGAELDIASNTYTGTTTVLAGTLKATASNAIRGNLVVGGGASAASFISTASSTAIDNNRNVTVNSNGTVTVGDNEKFNSLTVNGGAFNNDDVYIDGSITMTGGAIAGNRIHGNHSTITTNASSTTALISSGNNLNTSNATFNVADGGAYVDLKVTGTLGAGGGSYSVTKSGAGVMALSGANSQASTPFTVTNGTLLVNNTSGSGTGPAAVNVSATSANATLGGTGIIGGVAGYSNANVTLTGSASYTATLAPGGIDESTGAHVFNNLNVGSATQNNNVTFNNYSRLLIHLSNNAYDILTSGLLDLYRHTLLQDVIPFWLRHAIDPAGGINTCIADDGTVLSRDKWLWSQWRAVWVFSKLYNDVERRRQWLQVARHTYEFATRFGWDDQVGGWRLLLSGDGQVMRGCESVYVDGFAIYGLVEYAKTTGDEQAIALARRTADHVLRRLQQADIPHFPYPIPPGSKPHGIPMMFSLVLWELGQFLDDDHYRQAAARMSDEIFAHFYRPRRDLIVERISLDNSEYPAPLGTAVVPGHVVEDMWFQIHIARDQGNAQRVHQAIRLMRRHMEVGWDRQYGGLLLAIDADGNQEVGWSFADTKLWWPHTEALYGLLLAYEIGREDWCLQWHRRVHEYAYAHYPVPELATSKVLHLLQVPFSYIDNCRIDEPALRDGLDRFLRAARVAKMMRTMRIGQLGQRIDFSWTTIASESDLLQRFGVQVLPLDITTFLKGVRRLTEQRQADYRRELSELRSTFQFNGYRDDAQILPNFAFRDELLRVAREHQLDGFYISTFPAIQAELGSFMCLGACMASDAGYPAAMEGDLHGAVSLILLQAAGRGTLPFLPDVTIRHPDNDNAVLLWHPEAPLSLRDPGSPARVDLPWILKGQPTGLVHFRLKDGPLTVCRFDGDPSRGYRLGVGEGHTVPGPYTQEIYAWMQVNDWPTWERQLMQGPYIHHCAALHERCADVLAEAVRFIPSLCLERFGEKG